MNFIDSPGTSVLYGGEDVSALNWRAVSAETKRPPLFARIQPRITPNEIISEVADRNRLTVSELLTPTRAWRIAHPRQEAMYELKRRTKLSLKQIARRLGLRNHTTVLKGIRAYEERGGGT